MSTRVLTVAGRQPVAFALLAVLLLSACLPPATPGVAPSPAAAPTASATPTREPTPTPLAAPESLPSPGSTPTAGPWTTGGEFLVRNTSPDMPEVLVEAMAMRFEFQLQGAGSWQTLAASCGFDPAVPLLVRQSQSVRYDCRLQQALPPGAQLRAAVEIRLLGSDQVFRLQVEQ